MLVSWTKRPQQLLIPLVHANRRTTSLPKKTIFQFFSETV
jgi:hypothetical protein